MEARETDKLFREKLKNAPTTPNAGGWERLESMLDEQAKVPMFGFWRVAAAVLLLIVSGLVMFFWDGDKSLTNQVAVIKPPLEGLQDRNVIIPEIRVIEDKGNKSAVGSEVIQTKNEKAPKAIEATRSVISKEKVEVVESEEVEAQQLAQVETVIPDIEATPEKKRFKSIKITYKRGNKPLPKQEEMVAQQKVDSTGNNKIKELWEQTREIKPGDLWADIRDAKDNLFQRNSKKNVKNLNK
ncbi:hypothetical protein SAMN04488029_0541 [Reichenbachiella faecimaris]|uniref:Uncharacterized protein n=1 Tax=Reichenbachiella faecimaris TaxID=692418 RepID=A0A1W2G694_REIFA|nr:hypothetical protein [Reichenbachiella faecimaris]SMD32199.1 hypothetical protein SAMN04488029_0541 [Reichenbachiella faecimaris]